MWTRVAHPAPPSHSRLWYVRAVSDPPRLPEEFAPTGSKPSRFRIAPQPPLRPRLFPDEAKFALRLSLLAGSAEFAAWAWFAHAGGRGAVLGWAALRLLKPAWSFLGTRVPRPAVAFALLLGTAAPGAEPRRVGTVAYATLRRLYLDAGAREGLAPGQVLHIKGGTCRVEEVSPRYASCVGRGRPGDTFDLPLPLPALVVRRLPLPAPAMTSIGPELTLPSAPVAVTASNCWSFSSAR